jgi:hypothetical protein
MLRAVLPADGGANRSTSAAPGPALIVGGRVSPPMLILVAIVARAKVNRRKRVISDRCCEAGP